jgi:hypothetical protein
MEDSKLPHSWKSANITPIHKKGSKHTVSNYRSISLTSILCKVMEKISSSLFTDANTLVSSAKSLIMFSNASGRSFMYMANSMGPNTLPCGIPLATSVHDEFWPFNTTLWLLKFNKSKCKHASGTRNRLQLHDGGKYDS